MSASVTDPGVESRLATPEGLVLETFGMPLLAHLCATDEETVVARLEAKSELPPAAEGIFVDQLVPLAQFVAAQLASSPGLPIASALDVLVRPATGGQSSIGVALRRAAGGSVPDELVAAVADDQIKAAVSRMALDAFPLLLVPADLHWAPPIVSLHHHPQRKALQGALEADPELSGMFTKEDPGLGRRGYISTTLGASFSIQDVMFGEMMIASAWDTVKMTSKIPSQEDLLKRIQHNVDVLRLASTGKNASIPAHLVFTGFTTSENREITTPWGRLRPLTAWERSLAPASLEGAVTGTGADGDQVTVSYAGEMVLETELPYAIRIDAVPDWASNAMPSWRPMQGHDTLRRRLERMQLAAMLSTDREPGSWVTARLAWSWTGNPFGHGGNTGWGDPRGLPGFMPAVLSFEECADFEQWATRVDASWTGRIDIAVRRLLNASNARTDMADRLVDSVIVWENLFGTSQGEPRLRISAALAWLLEGDPAAREELQVQLKTLYDYRSKIVHGSNYDESTLGERATEALTYARDAMRVLIKDRPDVLGLAHGAARSLRMIMGG